MDECEGEGEEGWRMEEGETPYTPHSPTTMKVFWESGQYVHWATEECMREEHSYCFRWKTSIGL